MKNAKYWDNLTYIPHRLKYVVYTYAVYRILL